MSETDPPNESSHSPGVVLVVDDHELVLKAVVAALIAEELRVLSAMSGEEAITIIRNNQSISCVLLDLSMPAMNGVQVLEELAQIRPALPVVVYSAHDETTVAHKIDFPNVAGYWQKPFAPEQLAEQLRSLSNHQPV